MAEDTLDKLKLWYMSSRPLYEGLSNIVQSTLEALIKREKIDYLSVTSRTKTLDSVLEKAKRKPYRNPEKEITDLAGIRVITFIESDVTKVCDLIKSSFNIFPAKSLDKTAELGVDRFGYRSVHFVCDLGENRVKLPEFSPYADMLFEIQVRTVLQHAWAEIEHDRNYKFSGVLPAHIQRRLNSLAGVLEIVDREFAALAGEVDRYAGEVSAKTRSGDLNIEVNTTSLLEYLPEKLSRTNKKVLGLLDIDDDTIPEKVIDELRSFGIQTLSDLDKLLSKKFLALVIKHQHYTTYSGLLRDAMMYGDIDRYFGIAWKQNWKVTDDDTPGLLSEKYGSEKVLEILESNDIEIVNSVFG